MKRIISILLTLALILGMSFSLSEDVAAKELISEEQLCKNTSAYRGMRLVGLANFTACEYTC
jgi:hypothetical protein